MHFENPIRYSIINMLTCIYMYVYTIDYSHLQHMMYDALHLFYLPYWRSLESLFNKQLYKLYRTVVDNIAFFLSIGASWRPWHNCCRSKSWGMLNNLEIYHRFSYMVYVHDSMCFFCCFCSVQLPLCHFLGTSHSGVRWCMQKVLDQHQFL